MYRLSRSLSFLCLGRCATPVRGLSIQISTWISLSRVSHVLNLNLFQTYTDLICLTSNFVGYRTITRYISARYRVQILFRKHRANRPFVRMAKTCVSLCINLIKVAKIHILSVRWFPKLQLYHTDDTNTETARETLDCIRLMSIATTIPTKNADIRALPQSPQKSRNTTQDRTY